MIPTSRSVTAERQRCLLALSDLLEEAQLAARSLLDYGDGLINPTVRLGVTGLSRAGKTVFITALVHGLLRGGRFPVFEALAGGRIASARLEPQPDDTVPRFDYENHLRALIEERRWPSSTVDISELRLVIDYQRRNGASRSLTLDIADYPGEWLLDLPLLDKSYAQWSAESLALSREGPRQRLAGRVARASGDAFARTAKADEQAALTAAKLFTAYLKACRDERYAMSLLPPGRFLMPGSVAGSPALTFAPLDLPPDGEAPSGSLWAMMQRRYDSYVSALVRPFFRDHFARLDRQIVLVDALAALNAGPDALHDLQAALTSILDCFRVGRRSFFSSLFRPRIDRILFAATKADHLHHANHDRLEAIVAHMVKQAIERSESSGAAIDVVALAAVRATREARVQRGREELPSIIGTPLAGERAGGATFDGDTEAATFPGDLPDDPASLFAAGQQFKGLSSTGLDNADYRFLRFRPPLLERAIERRAGLAAHPPRPCAAIPDRRPARMTPTKNAAGRPRSGSTIRRSPSPPRRRTSRRSAAFACSPRTTRSRCPCRSTPPVPPARKGFRWGALFWSALGGLVSLGAGLGRDAPDRGPVRALGDARLRRRRAGRARGAGAARHRRARAVRPAAARSGSRSCTRAPPPCSLSDDRDEGRAVAAELHPAGEGEPAARARPDRADPACRRHHRRRRPRPARRARADGAARRGSPAADLAGSPTRVGGHRGQPARGDRHDLRADLGAAADPADRKALWRPARLARPRKLFRQAVTHLAVTGSVAIGDGLIQQALGHGLASRLSAKLGEGVLNGFLTARLGLAALDVIRPLPFATLPRPVLTDLIKDLTRTKDAT